MKNSKLAHVLKLLLLAVFTIMLLFPIYWGIVVSVIPSENLLSKSLSWLVPKNVTFQHYVTLFQKTDFTQFFLNSLYVAVITTGLTLVVSCLGGYALGRIAFKGRKLIGRLILFTYVIPSVLLLVPLFTFISSLGIQNSRLAIILSYMTFSMPFCLWMLRGFFASLPKGIEEAALIDGTSMFGAFYKIVLPLAAPGIVASAIFTFMLSWNEYLFAMVFITDNSMKTIPVGVVSTFFNTVMTPADWCVIMAASVIASFPVYFIFVFTQKYLVAGLAAGAVKE